MPEPVRILTPLPISHVRVAGAEALLDEQHVYCQRLSATVSVSRCRECRHFRALRPAVRDSLAGLVCDEARPPESHSALKLPRLSVGDLMERDVVCVRTDLSLDAAAVLLLEQPERTLPVVDANGHVVGTLCDAELQLEIQSGRTELGTVLNAMTPCALTVPESTSVTRAAAIMAFEDVSCLIVTAPGGAVSGVISATDLLAWLARADGYLARSRKSSPP